MSQLEVDKIIPQSGTTLTIGETGDTISLPSGVNLDTLTITGDLTVDTNTLYVDSTNNKVVMGSTSRYGDLDPFLEITKATTTSTVQGFASFNLFGGTGVRRPFVFLNRSRGTTEGDFTAVSSGDLLGTLAFAGSDGTEFITGSSINGYVDGAVSTGTVPGGISFKTSDTERMRIANDGVVTATVGFSGDGSALTEINTPAFQAYLSSDQTITDNTTTKVQFDTEVFDTDGCYDNATNYRFTPTVAGKYFVYAQIRTDTGGSSQAEYISSFIEKNGSRIASNIVDFRANNGRQAGLSLTTVVEMNGSTDYVEGYALANDTSGNPSVESSDFSTYFGAYRLGV